MSERRVDTADCSSFAAHLTALLDDELAGAERRQVEDHLRGCTSCTASLADQQAARSALRASGLRLAAPPALRASIQRDVEWTASASSSRHWYVAIGGLAAILALLAVVGLARQAQVPRTGSLLAHAVQAHKHDTLHGAAVSFVSADPSAVSGWAKSIAGHGIDVPSLAQAGYTLMGARPEPSVARDAVSLVYNGPQGDLTCTVLGGRVNLGGRLVTSATGPSIHYARLDGSSVAGWQDTKATYLLTGNLDPSALLKIARLASRRD